MASLLYPSKRIAACMHAWLLENENEIGDDSKIYNLEFAISGFATLKNKGFASQPTSLTIETT